MNFINHKNQIREKQLKIRATLSISERKRKSLLIQQSIIDLIFKKKIQQILSYYNHQSEVETDFFNQFCLGQAISIGLPRVCGKKIEFFNITNLDSDLDKGYFGIYEPKKKLSKVLYDQVDFALIPGVAFDLYGCRTGYGKGFYDAFLSSTPHFIKIGLAFECQLVDKLPTEKHDEQVDYLITEKNIYQF